jgi:glycine dehydrogenase
MMQYPDTTGAVKDWSALVHKAHEHEVMTVACTDLLASVLIRPAGEIGFDIAVGSAQRFGVPMVLYIYLAYSYYLQY